MEGPSKQLKQNIGRAIVVRMCATDIGQGISLTGNILALVRIAVIKLYNGNVPDEIETRYGKIQTLLLDAAQDYAQLEFWPSAQSKALFAFIELAELISLQDLVADDSLSIDVMQFVAQNGVVAGQPQGNIVARRDDI